ncbi:MAG TPA: ABC transporter ATP-binding protein [Armatimonadota bacterium]|nr:ABC transporter ATP-binding protein [Armatimonadota bacterium]
MKELLRLRQFASGLVPVALAAALAIGATGLLRGAAIWQIQGLIKPALDEGADTDANREFKTLFPKANAWIEQRAQEQEENAESTGAGDALKQMFPSATAWVERQAEGISRSWRDVFRVDEAIGSRRTQRLLIAAAVGLLLIGIAGTATDMASVYMTQHMGQRVLFSVRQQLFEHLQSLPLKYFEDQRSGDLLSRISNDTTRLQMLFSSPIAATLAAPPTCLIMVLIMVLINWRLTIAVFVLLPVIWGLTAWLGAKMKRYARAVQARMADLVAFSEQTLNAMRVVQAFGMEPHVNRLFGDTNRAAFRTAMRGARVRSFNTPITSLILILGLATSLLIGANEMIANRMEPGKLFAFVIAMQVLGASVSRITRLNMTIQQTAAASARIFEIIDTKSDLTDAPNARDLTEATGRITFRDVSFRYDEETSLVLDHVDLEIEPGEVVAVAGPSGAGKTTLANLVPRLYDVTDGQVLVDGADVRDVTRASLRGLMGMVPQETILFGTSVADNIRYGSPDATIEQVVEAAKAAQAHDFVEALPLGYDTEIGERGAKLSGGQRQRIAIARALLRDPRILILDEATSSLDAESEGAVQAAINRLLEGRTALIIAHRLSTIREADRILVMESGRVVEQGSHADLMASGGLYKALYETQLQKKPSADDTPEQATAP